MFVTRGRLNRPEFLKKWNEKRDLGANEVHLYKAAGGHNHESDFIDGIYENRLKWDPAAERFTGANAESANALLEVKHHNGWTL